MRLPQSICSASPSLINWNLTPIFLIIGTQDQSKGQGYPAPHQAVGKNGREVVLLVSLQSRTQPHRNALAPDEAQVDGGQYREPDTLHADV